MTSWNMCWFDCVFFILSAGVYLACFAVRHCLQVTKVVLTVRMIKFSNLIHLIHFIVTTHGTLIELGISIATILFVVPLSREFNKLELKLFSGALKKAVEFFLFIYFFLWTCFLTYQICLYPKTDTKS